MARATSSFTTVALALAMLATAGAAGSAAAQPAAPASAAPASAAPTSAAPASAAPTSASPAPARAPLPAPAAVKKAAPVSDKGLWKDLSRPQQIALAPLAGEWDRMESVRKQKWLDIANRYSSMKPDEQLRVQERMRDWMKLTPEERRVARENYTLSKKIDKSQKSVEWEKYQQLPDEEKKKLAADAAATKKQVTNLPPQTPSKPLAPSKPTPPAVCPPGTIRNAPAAVPRCIASPSAAVPLAVPAVVPPAAPAAAPPAAATPPITAPGNPATPVPNAK